MNAGTLQLTSRYDRDMLRACAESSEHAWLYLRASVDILLEPTVQLDTVHHATLHLPVLKWLLIIIIREHELWLREHRLCVSGGLSCVNGDLTRHLLTKINRTDTSHFYNLASLERTLLCLKQVTARWATQQLKYRIDQCFLTTTRE